MTKFTKATLDQIVEIGIMLREHCATGPNGIAVYAEGFNDDVIAERTGAPGTTVARMRLQKFGALTGGGKSEPKTELEDRIEKLERFMTHLYANWKSWPGQKVG